MLPASASSVVEIGAIASLTRPVALVVDSESAGLVIKIDEVVVGPVPAVVIAAAIA